MSTASAYPYTMSDQGDVSDHDAPVMGLHPAHYDNTAIDESHNPHQIWGWFHGKHMPCISFISTMLTFARALHQSQPWLCHAYEPPAPGQWPVSPYVDSVFRICLTRYLLLLLVGAVNAHDNSRHRMSWSYRMDMHGIC